MAQQPVIGIAGLGTMGLGIAQVFAQAGFAVLATDATGDVRGRAAPRLASALDARVAAGKLTGAERDAALGRLQVVGSVKDLAAAGLVIEAIAERLEAKRGLFAALERVMGSDAVLATNTSSLSVAALVQAMAAFGTPAGGERSLARADVQQYLTPLPAPGAQGAPGKAGRRGLAQRGNQPDSAPPSGRLPLAVPGPSPAPAGNGMRRHPTSGTGRVQW